MTRSIVAFSLLYLLLASCQSEVAVAEAEPIKALILDGQSSIYHSDWQERTELMKSILDGSGLFTVDVATSPAIGEDNVDFQPAFSDYDVVVVNYEGDYWSAATQTAFEEYISGGGGFVSIHATDNAFPDWTEFNRMIGVGGWGPTEGDPTNIGTISIAEEIAAAIVIHSIIGGGVILIGHTVRR